MHIKENGLLFNHSMKESNGSRPRTLPMSLEVTGFQNKDNKQCNMDVTSGDVFLFKHDASILWGDGGEPKKMRHSEMVIVSLTHRRRKGLHFLFRGGS